MEEHIGRNTLLINIFYLNFGRMNAVYILPKLLTYSKVYAIIDTQEIS